MKDGRKAPHLRAFRHHGLRFRAERFAPARMPPPSKRSGHTSGPGTHRHVFPVQSVAARPFQRLAYEIPGQPYSVHGKGSLSRFVKCGADHAKINPGPPTRQPLGAVTAPGRDRNTSRFGVLLHLRRPETCRTHVRRNVRVSLPSGRAVGTDVSRCCGYIVGQDAGGRQEDRTRRFHDNTLRSAGLFTGGGPWEPSRRMIGK